MFRNSKRGLYFFLAHYFGFWARFVLRRWKPRIIVVTGSSGKTTTLHLIEAQLQDKAIYSHHANSAFGIPFHILGMQPNVERKIDWITYLVKAPLKIFRSLPKQKIYVVEADCDRPNEGKFLANLLTPEVTLWVSVYHTHSMNFDKLLRDGKFKTHKEAISFEFGNFAAATTQLVVANDSPAELTQQLKRIPKTTKVKQVSIDAVVDYQPTGKKTEFTINNQKILVAGLHTKELGVSLQLVDELLKYLGEPIDNNYQQFNMPPGRNSVFFGKKQTVLVDSTYNTGVHATSAVLRPFMLYPSKYKWLVLGDILEQGSLERSEHEKLAELVESVDVDHIVLLGPRTKKYTYPILQRSENKTPVVSFDSPKEVLDYLEKNIVGGEAILFKGGRFLEGVIEQLLANPAESTNLVRREAAWTRRRQQWGLPK